MSSCNCMLLGREIATNTNSVAGECQVDNYVGVLFAYFDYLLQSFGFKTCRFGGSQL